MNEKESNMSNSLKDNIQKLEELFDIFNEKYYNKELQKPIIAVYPDHRGQAYGWFTPWKSWKKNGQEDSGFYEINMCAEHLNRDLLDICATLLHEMVHLYNFQINVKDTSRGNSYHNVKFKNEAERRGLMIDKNDKYGWTITSLQESTKEFINSLKDKTIPLYRDGIYTITKEKKKGNSKSIKYVCSECGISVRATKEVLIMCKNCMVEMECDV